MGAAVVRWEAVSSCSLLILLITHCLQLPFQNSPPFSPTALDADCLSVSPYSASLSNDLGLFLQSANSENEMPLLGDIAILNGTANRFVLTDLQALQVILPLP